MKTRSIVAGILAVIVAAVAAGLFVSYRFARNISVRTPSGKTETTITSLDDYFKQKKPFSLLLLGFAGGKHDGTYLTDSIMVAHIIPETKKIQLLSIPRDTWISIPTRTNEPFFRKLNAAYFIGMDDKGYPNKSKEFSGDNGGGKLAQFAVSQIIGEPVSYFLAIDFEGFKKTIDTLGGVDITVEKTFDDYAYPVEDIADESCGKSEEEIKAFTATISAESQLWDYFPCRYRHLHFDAGITHMDGDTALSYVRSRHSAQDGSDFGRAKRQRNLIVAVKNKILSPTFIPKAIPFLDSLAENFKTDIPVGDLKSLVTHVTEINSYEIQTLALTDKNFLNLTYSPEGQSILAPKEGIGKWDKVHEWIDAVFSGKQYKIPAIVQVENATRTSGLGLKLTEKLNAEGIQTVQPTNTREKTPKTAILLYDKNINADDISKLIKATGADGVVYETHDTDEYNVLVRIGADYTEKMGTP